MNAPPRTLLRWGLGGILGACVAASFPAHAEGWRWAAPVRLATAVCSRFEGVSDLPMAPESGHLLERLAAAVQGSPPTEILRWRDGSAEDFLRWIEDLAAGGQSGTDLVFWFATHQKRDGRLKFSSGPDLAPGDWIAAVNRAAAAHARLLLIHDCCHAAELERIGGFRPNVTRFYAARANEDAADVEFSRAPFGVAAYARPARAWLRAALRWDPPGMTQMGLYLLEGGRQAMRDGGDCVDLQSLVAAMNAARERFNDEVRQARAQHVVLAPSEANFVLLRRGE